MKKIINTKFYGNEAKSLIERFGGFVFLSKKSENEIKEIFVENERYSMKEVVGALIIISIKNFDTFDMNALSQALDCDIDTIEQIFNKKFMKKYLPLKLGKNYVNKNMLRLKKELNDLNEGLPSDFKRTRIERIEEVLQRFDNWVRKSRIIILDVNNNNRGGFSKMKLEKTIYKDGTYKEKKDKFTIGELKKVLKDGTEIFIILEKKDRDIIYLTKFHFWRLDIIKNLKKDYQKETYVLGIEKGDKKYLLNWSTLILDERHEFYSVEEIIDYLDKKGYLKREEWIKDEEK